MYCQHCFIVFVLLGFLLVGALHCSLYFEPEVRNCVTSVNENNYFLLVFLAFGITLINSLYLQKGVSGFCFRLVFSIDFFQLVYGSSKTQINNFETASKTLFCFASVIVNPINLISL